MGNDFINKFISIGLNDFFLNNSSSNFEAHIIECLCDIYGQDDIKRAYITRDESLFIDLIYKYGFSKTMYDNFIRDTLKYEVFKQKNAQNPALKSDIASKIEVSVITMFLYKCLLLEPSLEEISHFENNLLNNFAIIKMHFNTSVNPNRTREVWDKKKRMMIENVELIEIKPEYLDEATYTKYGTSLQDVKKMDYRMVNQLNSYIQSKQSLEVDGNTKRKSLEIKSLLRNTAISSGNGYVDALIIASIIATGVSLTLIYIFLH